MSRRIHPHNGRWHARVRLPDGRERRRTFASKRNAMQWAAAQHARTQHEQHVAHAAERITLAECIARWTRS